MDDRSGLLLAAVLLAAGGSVVACSGADEPESGPATTADAGILVRRDGDGAADGAEGAATGTPQETAVRWAFPADCADVVDIYSDAAWEQLADGRSREEARAECEAAPEEYGIGTADEAAFTADDVQVTSADDTAATVTYEVAGSGEGGSSAYSYTWDLVLEDGEWKVDELGGGMGFDASASPGG